MRPRPYWIALFSHSGAELSWVIKGLDDIEPFAIFTNQTDRNKIVDDLRDNVVIASHPEIMDEIMTIAKNTDRDIIITLNGYMRIIPPEIINLPNVKIYNVHPGDIITYPELRGADPQQKALDLKLPSTGVVIHEVDEGVDTGPILSLVKYNINQYISIDTLIADLRVISIKMWIEFLKGRL